MYNSYITIFILFKSCTSYKVSIHQTYFVAWEQTEIFLRRLFHKVFSLNIKLSSKWKLTASKFFILKIIRCIQIFNLSFWIVIDHKLDRIKDCHHTCSLKLQILTDAVLEHCIIYRALCFGNSTQVNEHLDRFRCESTATKCCDRNQSRIIPSVYDLIFYKFLDVTLSCNYVRQV